MWMLMRVARLLRQLNALEASANKTPWLPSLLKTSLMAWIAALLPHSCPAHNCIYPVARCTSSLRIPRTAFPMVLLTVSPIPMGHTPGFLSKAISLQAVKEDKPSGSTYSVHSLLAINAMLLQRSDEALEKDVHILHQPEASMPDGPAEPCIRKMVSLIVLPSRLSKMTGWNAASLGLSSTILFRLAGFPSGCLLLSSSSTVHSFVCPGGGSTRLWGDRGPPPLSSVMSFRAALVLL